MPQRYPAGTRVIGQSDEAAAAKIGPLPDQKITRLVDDLGACPRLASTANPHHEKENRNGTARLPATSRHRLAAKKSADRPEPYRRPEVMGLGFLVTSLGGDLLIGAFPRPDTPLALSSPRSTPLYHAQLLGAAGILLALSGISFALFGTAVWARIRQAASNPMLAGLAMIATALVAVTTLAQAGAYGVLGDIGGQHVIMPAALQAWHIMGSAGSLADGASTFLFLLAVAEAGILAPVFPRWLSWSALILAVLQVLPDPAGFLASLVFLLWAGAAGIVMLITGPARAPELAAARGAAQRRRSARSTRPSDSPRLVSAPGAASHPEGKPSCRREEPQEAARRRRRGRGRRHHRRSDHRHHSPAPAPGPPQARSRLRRHIQIMSTSTASSPASALAYGEFHRRRPCRPGRRQDRQGHLPRRHHQAAVAITPATGTTRFNPRTCLAVISQPGTYRIVGGTGRYAGIRGHGRYQLSLMFIAARSKGKCSSAKAPVARQELLRLSGPVRR